MPHSDDSPPAFGPHFTALPHHLQDLIAAEAVKSPDTIQLANLDAAIDTLAAPFEADHRLWLEARKQALRVNAFELNADRAFVVEDQGEPAIICVGTGQTLTTTRCSGVRDLRVTFAILARGCDWDKRQPVPLDAGHGQILRALPKLFPMLTSLTIHVQNFGERTMGIWYSRSGTPIHPRHLPSGLDRERRLQMMQLVRAVIDLELPAWRVFAGPPTKTLVFVQHPTAVDSAACKKVRIWRDKNEHIDVKGLAGCAARAGGGKRMLGARWVDWMWEWCDWPKVLVAFGQE